MDAVLCGLRQSLELGFDVLIEGEATGADIMARQWAGGAGIPVERYPADWDRYGKAAGPIRNAQMLDADPDLVIAFVNKPLSASRGTNHMVGIAQAACVPTWVIEAQ